MPSQRTLECKTNRSLLHVVTHTSHFLQVTHSSLTLAVQAGITSFTGVWLGLIGECYVKSSYYSHLTFFHHQANTVGSGTALNCPANAVIVKQLKYFVSFSNH